MQKINGIIRRVPAWPIYIVSAAWFGWQFFQALTGAMGPDPVRSLELALGTNALQMMVAVVAITPARKYLGLNLIKYRRAVGLSLFFFVTMHLSVWLFLDVQALAQVITDILKRPYITVGMVSFVVMIPLAITSNNRSIRKLGPKVWNTLHKLTYAAVLLGAVHNVMVQKVWETSPLVYLGLIAALLATRVTWRPRLLATA